ncbi:unnamed protein product [Blepharisma stoltei]|uniref:Uncharacterized protein n=1 Tax=Blepharisma stoltei TaxID=1481888 RepID=A0AAU9IY66_9CILI|nr:unnamed protein product [Blepharisma stoltei]
MVHQLSVCVFFVLFAFSYAGSFSYCANFIFTLPYFNPNGVRFDSQLNDGLYVMTFPTQTSSVVLPTLSCSWMHMNANSWSYTTDYSTCCSLSDFGLGIWVNFESIAGYSFMTMGNIYGGGPTYLLSSDTDGTLKFRFIDYAGQTDSFNQFTIPIPMNTWTLLAFHWIGNTFEIFMPGQGIISKISVGAYPFAKPDTGNLSFGNGIKAKLYQILGFKSATINTDFTIITLSDGTNLLDATGTCPMTCADSTCHPTQKCLRLTSDCSSCNPTGCLACTTSTRVKATYCTTKICNPHCICSPAGDCIACDYGYYLYKPLSGDIVCIECKDSCTSCDADCFECADAIAKDGTACRVDSIGYYVSISVPNIQFDFAHPLASALNIVSLTVKSIQGIAIDTSQWTLNTCAVGVTSCTIVANNLAENQLPIDFGFEFAQA